MSKYTIFHNPRCSKSRQTLQLLQDKGVEPEIRLYLDQPPSLQELKEVVAQLGIAARELLRKGEAEYKELGLASEGMSEQELMAAMADHPRLIERPIVIKESGGISKAVLGRPPENVLELL